MASEEFVLHFQPIFEIATGRMVGVESLIRWNHPTRGMVWPGEFIPTAEASDLILDIGRWVLERSCAQAKEWHDRWPALSDLEISINVSGRQLEQPDFVDQVTEIVRTSGIDPTTVILEVTETTLLQNTADAIAKLEALRALGVGVAIDDFGTGYSSLSYLQRFPATAIKLGAGERDRVDGPGPPADGHRRGRRGAVPDGPAAEASLQPGPGLLPRAAGSGRGPGAAAGGTGQLPPLAAVRVE